MRWLFFAAPPLPRAPSLARLSSRFRNDGNKELPTFGDTPSTPGALDDELFITFCLTISNKVQPGRKYRLKASGRVPGTFERFVIQVPNGGHDGDEVSIKVSRMWVDIQITRRAVTRIQSLARGRAVRRRLNAETAPTRARAEGAPPRVAPTVHPSRGTEEEYLAWALQESVLEAASTAVALATDVSGTPRDSEVPAPYSEAARAAAADATDVYMDGSPSTPAAPAAAPASDPPFGLEEFTDALIDPEIDLRV